MTDLHWAGHDQLLEDLRVGKAVVEGAKKRVAGGDVRKPKVLNRLHDLPDACWTVTPNESRGCQFYTRALIGPVIREVMLDSGAGVNTIPEEAVLEIINVCEAAGIRMDDEAHPIMQLETWRHGEECRGSQEESKFP